MSLWSAKQLEEIKNCRENSSFEHRFLTTKFMNEGTYSETAIRVFPYTLRREYIIDFHNDEDDSRTHYAVDEECLRALLKEVYIENSISAITQVITKFVPIVV